MTMLGIIIGVFSVVVVMSVGAGAQSLIVDQIAQRGTDQIAILAGASDDKGPPAQALGIIITTLTREDGEALLNPKNVTHMKDVAGYVSGSEPLSWKSEDKQVTFTGTMASYKDVERAELASGRFFTHEEELVGERLMVLGSEIAAEIFGNQNPIGEKVRLKRLSFRVIGVMEPKGSNPFEDVDNAVIIPLEVAQKNLLGINYVSFLRVQVTDELYIDQTIEEVKATLIERHGDEDFSVRNISDAISIVKNITDAMKFFLIAIAGIALFVGGVGVMNIMLIAVKEKTREIGLRKAVGAKSSDILLQFLIETIVMTVIGSAIGFILGALTSFGISIGVQQMGYAYTFELSLMTVVVAAIIAVLIGLVFGVYPARHASRLDPINALRYE